MSTAQQEEAILRKLWQAVVNYDEDAVVEAAKEVLEQGMDINRAVFQGLAAGMEEVGRLYELQEYFVPEMLMCSETLYAGLEILRPHMQAPQGGQKGRIIIGVVEGDIHDIGKNIVKTMLEVAGFEVYDLGRDVPLEKFLSEYLRLNADLICISAMMTTTMVGIRKAIRMIKKHYPKAKIMIGGAPVNEEYARRYNADSYAENAFDALQQAQKIIQTVYIVKGEDLDD